MLRLSTHRNGKQTKKTIQTIIGDWSWRIYIRANWTNFPSRSQFNQAVKDRCIKGISIRNADTSSTKVLMAWLIKSAIFCHPFPSPPCRSRLSTLGDRKSTVFFIRQECKIILNSSRYPFCCYSRYTCQDVCSVRSDHNLHRNCLFCPFQCRNVPAMHTAWSPNGMCSTDWSL